MSGQSKKVSRFVSNMVAILEDERRATIKTVNEEVQKQNGPEIYNTTHENALNTTISNTTTQKQTDYVAQDVPKIEKEKEEQTRSRSGSEAAKVESVDTKKSEDNNNNINSINYNFNRRHSRSGSIGSNPQSRSGSVSSLAIRDDDQQFEDIDTQRIESGELYESLKDILLSVKSKRPPHRPNATPTTRPHNYSRSPSLSSIDTPTPKSPVSNLTTFSQTQTENHTLSQHGMSPTHSTNNTQLQNTVTQSNSDNLNSSTISRKPLPLTNNEKVNKPTPSEVESLLLNMLAQREKLVNMIVSYSGENMETHRMLLGEVKNLDKAIQKLRGLDNNTNAEGLKVDLTNEDREHTQTPNSDPHIKLRSQSLTNGRRVSKATRDEVILRIKQRMDMEAKIEKDTNLNPKRHTLSHSLPERKLNKDNGANMPQNETLANLQQQNTFANKDDHTTFSGPNSKLEMERRKAKLLGLQSQLSQQPSPTTTTTTNPTFTSPNKSPPPSHSFMNDDEDEFSEPDYFNQQRFDPRMMENETVMHFTQPKIHNLSKTLTRNDDSTSNTPTPTQTLTRKNSFPQYSHTFSSASPIQVQQPFSPFSTAYLERMSQIKQTTTKVITTSSTPSPTPPKSTSPIQSHSPYQTLPHQPSIAHPSSTSNRYNTISNHQSSPYLKIDGDNKFVPYSFNYYW